MKKQTIRLKFLSVALAVLMIFSSLTSMAYALDIGNSGKVHKDGYISNIKYNFTGKGYDFGLPHRDSKGEYDKLSFNGINILKEKAQNLTFIRP